MDSTTAALTVVVTVIVVEAITRALRALRHRYWED